MNFSPARSHLYRLFASLFLLGVLALPELCEAAQKGKELVNEGGTPVVVTVTLNDGSRRDVTVPPHSRVAVPLGTTRVERDSKMRVNHNSRDSIVRLVGDGHNVDLPAQEESTGLVLDPNRPEVARPASTPVGGAVDRFKATEGAGKTVANYGDDPVEVDVKLADGRTKRMTISPGQRMALPVGTTHVELDTNTMVNHAARGASVRIEGDGASVDLKGQSDGTGVSLDPQRPEVSRPSHSSVDSSEGRVPLGLQKGKTVVNRGDRPVEVYVTTVDGRTKTVRVEPGQAVALPPETTQVKRDTLRTVNRRTEDVAISIEGDGAVVDLQGSQGGGGGVSLDPDRPEVCRPGTAQVDKQKEPGQFAGKSGKTVVNYGGVPVEVDVATADGQTERITIQPGEAVALPSGTTQVDRDMRTVVNHDGKTAQVCVEGDGQSMDVATGREVNGITLDPGRPEVVKPATSEVRGAPEDREFAAGSGKSVVNYGSKQVEVDIVTADGKTDRVTVQPGEAIALPPGVVSVERDMRSVMNHDGKGAPVRVEGDGQSVELGAGREVNGVTLDPERPEVAKPSTRKIAAGANREVGSFTETAGKTLVNYGDEPVEISVTTADGEEQILTVKPGEGVALPPDVVKVDRDRKSMVNYTGRASHIAIEGDGKAIEVSGKDDAAGIILDPNNPEVARPEVRGKDAGEQTEDADAARSIEEAEEDWDDEEDGVDIFGGAEGSVDDDWADDEDGIDVFGGLSAEEAAARERVARKRRDQRKRAKMEKEAREQEEQRERELDEEDAKREQQDEFEVEPSASFDGTYKGSIEGMTFTLTIRGGTAVFSTGGKGSVRGTIDEAGHIKASYTGELAQMGKSILHGTATWTGSVKGRRAFGVMKMEGSWSDMDEKESESSGWSATRVK